LKKALSLERDATDSNDGKSLEVLKDHEQNLTVQEIKVQQEILSLPQEKVDNAELKISNTKKLLIGTWLVDPELDGKVRKLLENWRKSGKDFEENSSEIKKESKRLEKKRSKLERKCKLLETAMSVNYLRKLRAVNREFLTDIKFGGIRMGSWHGTSSHSKAMKVAIRNQRNCAFQNLSQNEHLAKATKSFDSKKKKYAKEWSVLKDEILNAQFAAQFNNSRAANELLDIYKLYLPFEKAWNKYKNGLTVLTILKELPLYKKNLQELKETLDRQSKILNLNTRSRTFDEIQFCKSISDVKELTSKFKRMVTGAEEKVKESVRQLNFLKKKFKLFADLCQKGDANLESLTIDEQCLICNEKIKNPVVVRCGHMFCQDCLVRWLDIKAACPLCKRQIDRKKLLYVTNLRASINAIQNYETLEDCFQSKAKGMEIEYQPYINEMVTYLADEFLVDVTHSAAQAFCEKYETSISTMLVSKGAKFYYDQNACKQSKKFFKKVFDKKIDEKQFLGCKIRTLVKHLKYIQSKDVEAQSLVFTQYSRFFNLVEQALKANDIRCIGLHGSTMARARKIKNFKMKKSAVLLINLRSLDCSGLTLTNATNVFLLEPSLDSAVEDQAISRVHRLGQDKRTYVYRYFVGKSIEEKLLKRRLGADSKTQLNVIALENFKKMDLDGILN